MTISLAAVFIPVLFMGGIVGRLFREFAVVIGVAVLISGFISLTLTPMLSSRFLRAAPARGGTTRCTTCSSAFFAGMLRGLRERACAGRSRHRRSTLAYTRGHDG